MNKWYSLFDIGHSIRKSKTQAKLWLRQTFFSAEVRSFHQIGFYSWRYLNRHCQGVPSSCLSSQFHAFSWTGLTCYLTFIHSLICSANFLIRLSLYYQWTLQLSEEIDAYISETIGWNVISCKFHFERYQLVWVQWILEQIISLILLAIFTKPRPRMYSRNLPNSNY